MSGIGRPGLTGKAIALSALLLMQAGSAVFFALDAISDYGFSTGVAGSSIHRQLEFAASLTLVLSVILTGIAIRRVLSRQREIESRLRAASGAFAELLAEYFDRWDLTRSEREVALLAIKGFAIAEIAALRRTRPGTVKAQLNAIYTKAGVSGRHELLGLFIEELMGDGLTAPGVPRPAWRQGATSASAADEPAQAP